VTAGGADPFDTAASSFTALLRREAPELLPQRTEVGGTVPHVDGTTVLAVSYEGGVVMAGDRRATSGNMISKRDMRKVYEADAWSAVAIAGAAGPAMELAKLFATELEFYEKVEGVPLSLEGKANRLGRMVAENLPMALQGFVVVPLFAGFDPQAGIARMYEFDAVGGRYEERRFATNGSGGRDARGSLKARYHEDLGGEEAISMALEALWDAADEDSATGGPDLVRGIYPLVAVIDSEGYRELPDEVVAEQVQQVIGARRS
jgi:proteasome beta subunit